MKKVINSTIVQANYRQFYEGEKAPKIPTTYQSRLLIWCKGGKGEVTIQRKKFKLSKGMCFLTPWNHTELFVADKAEPFFVASVHIVPSMLPGSMNDFQLLTQKEDKQPHHEKRQNADIEGLEDQLIMFEIRDSSALAYLMDYVVTWFHNENKTKESAKMLASQLFEEINNSLTVSENFNNDYPKAIRQFITHIDWNFNKELTIKDLIKVGNCSERSLFRLFKEHLKTTPTLYILSRKLKYSQNLLASTNLRINEISQMSGFNNPHYFSRAFKKHYGITAIEYRRKNN